MFRYRSDKDVREPAAGVAALLGSLGPPTGAPLDRAARVAIAAMLVARHLDRPVDLVRVLEMALAEALPGDPAAIRDALDPDDGLHLFALLLERGNAGTSEARLVQRLGDLLSGAADRAPAGQRPRDLFLRDRFLRALAQHLGEDPSERAATG